MPHKDLEARRTYARELATKRRRAAGIEPRKVGTTFDPKAYYEANKERIRERAHERYQRDRERQRELARLRYDPTKARANTLRREYGLTLEDEQAMRIAQGGRCAICSQETTLVVDHDHESGEVRGLLCNACNSALGYFRDDPGRMEAAKFYLGVRVESVTVMPEVKAGAQIPRSFDAFVSSEWFRHALSQSARAVPIGSGALPAVVIRGAWAIVDLRKGGRDETVTGSNALGSDGARHHPDG